jgi:thiol-disulfide isomerase/thioredoxin
MKPLQNSLCLALLFAWQWNARAGSTPAPAFELPKWNSPEQVKLADFAGQVVVLDFFAYWCGPCKRASQEIEPGIQQYYESKRGTPHGVPVRVVAVNIEPDHPDKTARFIAEAGLKLVLNDSEAALFSKLGGEGTPFIVIIDGTRGTEAAPEFQIVYRKAGFEGTKKLRQVIDAIKPARAAENKSARRGDPEHATGPPAVRKGGIAFEARLSADVQLSTAAFNYGQQPGLRALCALRFSRLPRATR